MGFPGGYTDVILPKLLINALTFLDFLRTFTLTLMGCLGLSGLVDLDEPNHLSARPEPVLARPDSTSAALIREMLPSEWVSVGPGPARPGGCCAVCLYEYEEGEEIRRMRNCQHMFHRSCVDRWIEHDKDTCPLCRKPFVPKELEDDFNDKLLAALGIPDFYSDYSHITHFL
ncbi:hypothetical protein RND81_06G245600 [Saponaria officinalis]|uniref:RING-type domain-containing protein n=1 Tax=Saponaria officinalis TaxID=3572 RepID=A0AAW1KDV4_SAPOF